MHRTNNLIHAIAHQAHQPSIEELVDLLQIQGDDLECLYQTSDQIREKYMGQEVYLRGIIEFSNICKKDCAYCGIGKGVVNLERYRMQLPEIVAAAIKARQLQYTTVVLQSAEDPWFTKEKVVEMITAIKTEVDVAITLSIGEWGLADYQAFRTAGADRYLIRFETADRVLYNRIHPDSDYDQRMRCLEYIKQAGLQSGSGFMIGLPFSGMETIAADILFCTRLKLDMIGCGPFIASPATPLAGHKPLEDVEIYFKTIALLRLLNQDAHIPATTAFDALIPKGRDLLLTRGANVFMPNVTPVKYRASYQLYPNKPCLDEDCDQCAECVTARLMRLGRIIGTGYGHKNNHGDTLVPAKGRAGRLGSGEGIIGCYR